MSLVLLNTVQSQVLSQLCTAEATRSRQQAQDFAQRGCDRVHKLGCDCRLGQPFSGPQELHQLFSKYDTNFSGQLEFNEFLVLFKERLQDLQKTLQFISLKPAKSKATESAVINVSAAVIVQLDFRFLSQLVAISSCQGHHCIGPWLQFLI